MPAHGGVAISLNDARTIVQAALKHARSGQYPPMTVAVLDAAGQLVAFAREDGSSLLRGRITRAKARGALTYLSATLSGLDICYPGFGDHPLLGRRVPDVAINTRGRTPTIYELLRRATPILLTFSDDAATAEAATAWAGRITTVSATNTADTWTLPRATTIPAPTALLIRPDGYVGWVSDGAPDLADLREA